MSSGFSIGLNALQANSSAIEVASKNIAASNVSGYKASEYLFQEALSRSIQPSSSGRFGATGTGGISRRSYAAGSTKYSASPLDMSINGDGFFTVGMFKEPNSEKTFYTRSGQFLTDKDGFIVSSSGLYLYGYQPNIDASNVTDALGPLKEPSSPMPPSPTSSAAVSVNLDARLPIVQNSKKVPGNLNDVPNILDVNYPETYSHVQQFPLYDKLGRQHAVSLYFRRADEKLYDMYVNVDGQAFASTFVNGKVTLTMPDKPAAKQSVVSIGAGGVFEWAGSGLRVDDPVRLSSTGVLPPNIKSDETYYVAAVEKDNFKIKTKTGQAVAVIGGTGEVTVSKFTEFPSTTLQAPSITPSVSDVPGRLRFPNETILNNGQAIEFKVGASLPSGLLTGKTYYVVGKGGVPGIDEFEFGLSETLNGTPVTFPSVYVNPTSITLLNGVIKSPTHGLSKNDAVQFSSSGGLPRGLSPGVIYYVQDVKSPSEFTVSLTPGGDVVPIGTDAQGEVAVKPVPAAVARFGFFEGKLVSVGGVGLTSPVDSTKRSTTLEISLSPPLGDPYDPSVLLSDPISFKLDFEGTTNYASAFEIKNVVQDGYSAGSLSGLSVDDKGYVRGQFSNGRTVVAGQLQLATFRGLGGLREVSNNTYQATSQSGDPLFGKPTEQSLGSIRANSVEEANTDMASELVRLMVQQRNYQANAQSIRTQVEILSVTIDVTR